MLELEKLDTRRCSKIKSPSLVYDCHVTNCVLQLECYLWEFAWNQQAFPTTNPTLRKLPRTWIFCFSLLLLVKNSFFLFFFLLFPVLLFLKGFLVLFLAGNGWFPCWYLGARGLVRLRKPNLNTFFFGHFSCVTLAFVIHVKIFGAK